MEGDVLTQVTQIKWLLVVFVAIGAIRIWLAIWIELRKAGGLRASRLLRLSFHDEVQRLLEAGESAKAMAVAEGRIKEAPGDAQAYWFHASAAYRVGNFPSALRSLRKAAELEPAWGNTHINPFIQAIEAQTSARGLRADLHVLTPNPTFNPDVPPADVGAPGQPSGGGPPVNSPR